MKNAFCFLFLFAFAAPAFSATVKSAKLDAANQNILIDVVYGGGCGQHQFSLKVGGCLESYPVQCTAVLEHKTNDMCEALIYETVVINLKQAGLNNPYYSEGWLTIQGDLDFTTNKLSEATVRLPK